MKRVAQLSLLLLSMSAWAAESAGALPADARKREFSSLQNELEAFRPDPDAPKEQVLAYLELAMEKFGKFARDNPRTAEGFEAAWSVVAVLMQQRHVKTGEYAELAANVAPAAGVDVKRVAMCWALVADSRLQRNDGPGARAALEKVKPIDKDMFEQLSVQLDGAEKQLAEQREAAEKLQIGKQPFAMDETDTNGNTVSLAKLKGKVVLIDFWAPWCGPCLQEMPNLIKLYEAQKAKGFEIIGISLDKDKTSLLNTMKQHGMNWPVISDHGGWQSAMARKWGIRSIPMTYVLDRKGVIRHVGVRGAELDEAVQELIAEKP